MRERDSKSRCTASPAVHCVLKHAAVNARPVCNVGLHAWGPGSTLSPDPRSWEDSALTLGSWVLGVLGGLSPDTSVLGVLLCSGQ